MRFYQTQTVNLASGCSYVGTAIHELAHALGMDHEHNRPDRDDWIDIDYRNIDHGWQDQFLQNNNAFTEHDYDYLSIMHYGAYSTCKDCSKPVITPKKNKCG